jgi:predicted secreted Zn-dependent protease
MKLPFAFLALLCAWLTISCAGLTQASAPPFVYGEPSVVRYETTRLDGVTLVVNIWERTYAVPGTSASEVGDNLAALRRAGTGHGPYSASTKWDLKLSLRYADEPESCAIANATVEIVAVITLPALHDAGALEPYELARWQVFIENLKAHELQHVANEIEGAKSLERDLQALPRLETCRAVGDTASAMAEDYKRAILEADTRLDAETKHGALTGATFP